MYIQTALHFYIFIMHLSIIISGADEQDEPLIFSNDICTLITKAWEGTFTNAGTGGHQEKDYVSHGLSKGLWAEQGVLGQCPFSPSINTDIFNVVLKLRQVLMISKQFK